jgi:hypothetical protein
LQNFEFLSLKQCQSERKQAGRDVARAPARPRAPYAASASEPPRAFPRPRASPRPRAHQGLEARAHATWSPPPCRPDAPRETLRSDAVLLCAGAATDAARRTASKAGRPPPSTLLVKTRPGRVPFRSALPRTEPPPAPLEAAAVSSSSGRPQVQVNPPPTFPCTYPSSPACPSPPQNRHPAGTAAAAATAAGRRRPTSAVLSLPIRAWESNPRGPRTIPRPRLARPGRRFAGIWPDRRRPVPEDDNARFVICLGSFVQSKGLVVNLQKLPGASAQNCNFNSVADLQKLVKCVENR